MLHVKGNKSLQSHVLPLVDVASLKILSCQECLQIDDGKKERSAAKRAFLREDALTKFEHQFRDSNKLGTTSRGEIGLKARLAVSETLFLRAVASST